MGIMKRMPSRPPVRAMIVTDQKSKESQKPIRIIAGMVKMMPAARDSPAEAQVCTWFASNIVESLKSILNNNIAMTAAGIEADTVIPALSPT